MEKLPFNKYRIFYVLIVPWSVPGDFFTHAALYYDIRDSIFVYAKDNSALGADRFLC